MAASVSAHGQKGDNAAMLDLSIVIVGHNHRNELERALRSLFHQEHAVGFEAILVDNVSTDGTAEMVQTRFPKVKLIRNERRYGYARNGNTGIKAANNGKYILMHNPDLRCLPKSLETLVTFMEEYPDAGIAGPKLLNADLTLQYSCRRFSHPIVPVLRFLGVDQRVPRLRVLREEFMSDWDHSEPREVDYVTGACMILRRQALADVGLMDEGFFLYCDDQDWCLRMWHHGWKVYYVPQAVLVHDLQRDSTKRFLSKAQRAHIHSLTYLFYKHGLRLERPEN